MFTKQVIQHVIWSRQKDHAFPVASRSVPVNFSLGPRSSLVRLSFVIRQSIEDRSRTERGTSEKRTKEQRMSVEKLSKTRRNATILAGCTSFCNHKPTQCLSPKSAEVESCTSCLTLSIFSANKTVSSIPTVPMVQPCRNSLHGLITPCCSPNNRRRQSSVHPETPYHKPNSLIFQAQPQAKL